ncbi:MAG TPA: 4-alpha-glucanotransferase [Candidatus Binatia bacterium]|nr:4-alpha-glucanotransferase [Candidatus Binatia bacterium]
MTEIKPLRDLARFYHVQTRYRDGFNQTREAPVETILAVLRSLGAPIESLHDAPNALRESRRILWQRGIEPVVVGWEGNPITFTLRLPERLAEVPVKYIVALESGARVEGECCDEENFKPHARDIEGNRYLARRLRLQATVPLGYHRLLLQIADLGLESHLFFAPPQAYAPADQRGKHWGVFCPLYALWSEQSWGAGDLSDLEKLVDLVSAQNGHTVATLPMLAGFLDEPFNPSPYAPASRLFWNEFYLDVTNIAELEHCPSAQAMLRSSELQRELEGARAAPLIDYRRLMALKRNVLEALLHSFLTQTSERRESFEKFAVTHPRAQDYAGFRAKVERERKSWLHWPPSPRDGLLTPNEYDEPAKRYHLYAQWLCNQQIASVCRKAKSKGLGLYLDFPLGVNRDGFDVWRERELFCLNASGGAPPDSLFVKGQNWGFPPLHPEEIRRQGYGYYIDCLRHHMAAARMLRIDHVMGLHRTFWVPDGFSATDGLYVHGRAAEFYAILNLESHRHQVQIVGENLGTVPDYVNEAMARRKILGMHVGLFSINAVSEPVLDVVPANTVASIDTHDTATFMGFWQGADIQDRIALGLLEAYQAQNERAYRSSQKEALVAFLRAQGWLGDETSEAAVLRAWLAFLARQDEELLLINLEDLWLEAEPQNVPGTWRERPNWRRKTRYSIDDIRVHSQVAVMIKTVRDNRLRIK